MWPAIETLIPSAGMLFLLYVVLKHIVEGDRRERRAYAEWEAAQDAQESERPDEGHSLPGKNH